MKKLAILLFLLVPVVDSLGQRNCATEVLGGANNLNPQYNLIFENWIKDKLQNRNAVEEEFGTEDETVYQIPVVIHVIHNGEPVGLGSNIADAQVLSQIEVLNEDFNRLHADTVNTPAIFQGVASKVRFEFILARQNPNGLATNGIVRKQGSRSSWQITNYDELMDESYWPPADYLNIWTANITDFIGYATFPTSEIEPGLPPNELPKEGVLVTYGAFGSRIKYPEGNYDDFDFDKGRTASHEVGHYFGLRHIWGDGDCSVDDYVNDTPVSEDFYLNCPSLGPSSSSCGSQDMFMNFMDYVDDDCMNIFTLGQTDRMHVIINNSPNRVSLLSSPGLDDPIASEAELLSINSPEMGLCSDQILTNVTIRNNGTMEINTLRLEVRLNNVPQLTQTFNVTVQSLDTVRLDFDPFSLTEFGLFDFAVTILEVNGSPDAELGNNTEQMEILRPQQVADLDENFETWPNGWEFRTNSPVSAINIVNAIGDNLSNRAAKFHYYSSPDNSDAVQTPLIDISALPKPHLVYSMSYAYREGFEDNLQIMASDNCGASFDVILSDSSGEELSTTSHPIEHSPSGPLDWKFKSLDLSEFNVSQVQFAFIGNSDGGNNIYLDDIKVVDATYNDLALLGLDEKVPVYCAPIEELGVIIENRGLTTVNSTVVELNINGNVTSTPISNMNLPSGERQTFRVPVTISEVINNITIKIDDDDLASNNTIDRQILIQSNFYDLPMRESFEAPDQAFQRGWRSIAANHQGEWKIAINGSTDNSLYYNSFDDVYRGTQTYFVSPLLDFSNLAEASLRFESAYARNTDKNELLRVWASSGCDGSFDNLLAEYDRKSLTTSGSTTFWAPLSENDWQQKFLSLSSLLGQETVRLAFEITNDNGNNLYLDDIEILVTDDPEEVQIEEGSMAYYPNPNTTGILNLTFNLKDKETVFLSVKNTSGQLVSTFEIQNVLNQTFDFDMTTIPNGLYLIEVTSKSIVESFKISLNQ